LWVEHRVHTCRNIGSGALILVRSFHALFVSGYLVDKQSGSRTYRSLQIFSFRVDYRARYPRLACLWCLPRSPSGGAHALIVFLHSRLCKVPCCPSRMHHLRKRITIGVDGTLSTKNFVPLKRPDVGFTPHIRGPVASRARAAGSMSTCFLRTAVATKSTFHTYAPRVCWPPPFTMSALRILVPVKRVIDYAVRSPGHPHLRLR
jgi:hypothetical protein